MKNLLRKLHIGGSPAAGGSEIRHNLMPSGAGAGAGASPPSGSGNSGASGAAAAENSSVLDYNYLEEEYQVQLALAISASSSAPECGSSNDPESLQIKAAKRISLGHFPSPSPAASAVDFLSHRYWSYNVVDYDEKVIDGFYDVYCILADPSAQGKMPSLIDLQETPVSGNVGYEVVLVNRVVDPVLRKLEQKAVSIALECGSAGLNPIDSGLVQRIADLVAVQMGGPVIDADEIVTRWTMKSFELRTSLNNIVLPLGRLQIGLSRHRALLFKVLADCVGVPCRLVKGSYYTGTDDGAVNLIKVDNEREFIIDLMGAPGALIPTETPSISSVSNTAKENKNTEQEIIAQAVQTLCSALEEKDSSTAIDRRDSELGNDSADIDSYRQEVSRQGGHNFHGKCESSYAETRIEQRNFQPSRPRRSPSWTQGEVFSDQMKVNDVSKYVINAANENPGFAQKLHDVLMESGVSPPLDFFDSINSSQVLRDQRITQKNSFLEERKLNDLKKCDDKFPMVPGRPPKPIPRLNSSIHKGIYYDHQVALVEGVALHSKEKNESISNAPLMQTSTSNTMFAPIAPGIPSFVNSHISSAESSMVVGQSENVGVQQSIPVAAAVAATAAVVASSLVVATSKCNEVLATSSRVTEFNSGASVGLDKRSTLKCTSNYSNDDSSVSEDKVTVQEGSSWHLKDDNEHSLSPHSEHPVLDDVEECEIRWEDLQIGERIGLGSYGEVYHADWNGTEVAVKKFLDQAFSGDALEQFRSEVRIMRRMRHPNIVLFMGAVTRPPNLSILTEFLPRGSLYRLLHRSSVHLDEKRRLRMALDVAKGMNYLHTSSPVIVHRDLKSPNLLVDKNWVVKVCDFGLSRLKHHTFLSSKSTAGTPEWMAPEVLRNEPANEKCDVYSFGVILWELATLRMPWSGMNPMQVVGAVGFQNRRLEIPIDVDPLVAKIISQCWHNDPNMRPSFGQLMLVLKSLQRLVISTP